jgi:hypothetical protein
MAKERTPEQQAIVDKMDAAAKEAEKELKKLDAKAVKVTADWMAAHFVAAGYKRLCRLVVATTKAPAPKGKGKGKGAEDETPAES